MSAEDRDVCRRLRWKGMFVEVEPEDRVPGGSDGYCWCSRTMTALGPDGKVAIREACRPGRDCHEPR